MINSNTFRMASSHRLYVYSGAAALCLIVSCGMFLVLRTISGRTLSSIKPPHIVVSSQVSPHTDPLTIADTRAAEEKPVSELQAKLGADTRILIKVEKQRKLLLALIKKETPPVELHSLYSKNAIRQQLISEMTLLLRLEKENKSESSGVVAVRNKITHLQRQLHRGDASNYNIQKDYTNKKYIELGTLRAQVVTTEFDILADHSELAKFAQTKRSLPMVSMVFENDAHKNAVQTALPIENKSIRNEMQRKRAKFILWIAPASLLTGIASAVLLLFWMARRSDPFCNATSMTVLAERATFLGTIPRMHVR